VKKKIAKILRSRVFIVIFAAVLIVVALSLKFGAFNHNPVKSDVSSTQSVESDFSLLIPSIDVEAPIIQGVDPTNADIYNKALEGGVAHMNGTALPGDGKGNIFIYGHSSASIASKYDKIFAKLNDLNNSDTIVVSYKGSNYTYEVTDKKIVEKTDMSVLDQTPSEQLTLMTCWPIGTDAQRLVVIAQKK